MDSSEQILVPQIERFGRGLRTTYSRAPYNKYNNIFQFGPCILKRMQRQNIWLLLYEINIFLMFSGSNMPEKIKIYNSVETINQS